MSKVKLTPGDVKLLPFVFQSFEAPLKVNTAKLAQVGKYKNEASANTCWYSLKKKLFEPGSSTANGGKTATGSNTSSSSSAKFQALSLSANELKLLALIWECLDGGVPKVNNAKLAQLGGYKNPASANTCWYNLKKKLLSKAIEGASHAAGAGTDGRGVTLKKRVAGGALSGEKVAKKRVVGGRKLNGDGYVAAAFPVTKKESTGEGAEEVKAEAKMAKLKFEGGKSGGAAQSDGVLASTAKGANDGVTSEDLAKLAPESAAGDADSLVRAESLSPEDKVAQAEKEKEMGRRFFEQILEFWDKI
ncbi:hypothetical protein B0A50_05955 [Salinomyces thailandicus]|uniref:Uncharacterized protein n=1 Tax=Salinomyces thailandicus TaxID=706561 RepID=A0A4U0TQ18_9PEZI|nr:hypothetical protein B0A50_05955 [Salinomyces thailandica]